jgi:hypothetical protein
MRLVVCAVLAPVWPHRSGTPAGALCRKSLRCGVPWCSSRLGCCCVVVVCPEAPPWTLVCGTVCPGPVALVVCVCMFAAALAGGCSFSCVCVVSRAQLSAAMQTPLFPVSSVGRVWRARCWLRSSCLPGWLQAGGVAIVAVQQAFDGSRSVKRSCTLLPVVPKQHALVSHCYQQHMELLPPAAAPSLQLLHAPAEPLAEFAASWSCVQMLATRGHGTGQSGKCCVAHVSRVMHM